MSPLGQSAASAEMGAFAFAHAIPAALHFSRAWSPADGVDCGCRRAKCGMVDSSGLDDNCDQHPISMARTIRSGHLAVDCPEITFTSGQV